MRSGDWRKACISSIVVVHDEPTKYDDTTCDILVGLLRHRSVFLDAIRSDPGHKMTDTTHVLNHWKKAIKRYFPIENCRNNAKKHILVVLWKLLTSSNRSNTGRSGRFVWIAGKVNRSSPEETVPWSRETQPTAVLSHIASRTPQDAAVAV